MKVQLDYTKGQKVVCLINGKFTSETIAGSAFIRVNEDGSIQSAEYNIDRPDPCYPSIKMIIPSDNIWATKEEAMASVGLGDL